MIWTDGPGLMLILETILKLIQAVKPTRLFAQLWVYTLLAFPMMATMLIAADKVQPPKIVYVDKDGAVAYDVDAEGDRVPDFSNCGYAGANRGIPSVPVRVVVAPKSGDSTERIQKALNYVGSLPADENGIRGAVLLLAGRHEVQGSLKIRHSGVVLRGQGIGEDGTALIATGLDRRTLIQVLGNASVATEQAEGWEVSDDYVPVGAKQFHLKDTSGLKVSDRINVIRPSVQSWIDELGATEFGGGRGDWRLTWKPGSRDLVWDRVIESVNDNLVSVDAPITTAMESRYGGGYVKKYSWPGRIRNIGIENLRIETTFDPDNPKDEAHSWFAITLENTADAWVRQIVFRHFSGSAVAVYESCKQVTVQDCISLEPVSEEGGYRRHTFFTMGQLTLFLRCYAEGGRHDFSVGHGASGPNAFVQCGSSLPSRDSGPIESWASGVLYDNVQIDGNALSLAYRGPNPNGAGWSAANSVLWNCQASLLRCQSPPTAQNWAFGSRAEFEGNGHWRSTNESASPWSLYAAQLQDRVGGNAVAKLNLMPRPKGASSNPSIEKAQELAAASHEPPALLVDYIRAAGRREPIASNLSSAQDIDDILMPRRSRKSTSYPIEIINGWLTMDGKLLKGGITGIQWWRGNIRPSDAPTYDLGVTRFVPGRIGRGFSDDLDELANSMKARGLAALDHNYGLWYDRRRDDHERVRRMTGDVWPPFYELPFARTGQGRAWDGLSQYDLTKFNPWYWSRLKGFADRCDQHGLVLFHQNYFQHNILEAGAHWSDYPWRSANNVNNAGFPEPPPYAGDKRIFMAELFYDITHPVRRKLHEGYIRKCLENFTANENVIQFTSAEFTGPLSFVEFWLDTIAQWEETSGRDPLIALSCPKDVQDVILKDKNRRATVDLIDFRYWWRTDKGEFSPPGGKNLAPRQFERRWRGGRPEDANLALMASEYRGKYPEKALITEFDTAAWAWVCAGGSIPRLPISVDDSLLRAIPRMNPWIENSQDGRWTLREAGKQILIFRGNDRPLDLSEEPGAFRCYEVDTQTGQLKSRNAIKGGGMVDLPDAELLWMTKEN